MWLELRHAQLVNLKSASLIRVVPPQNPNAVDHAYSVLVHSEIGTQGLLVENYDDEEYANISAFYLAENADREGVIGYYSILDLARAEAGG